MKELYDWVPWFKELGEQIAKGGERFLIDRVETVAWSSPSGAGYFDAVLGG